MDVSISNTFMAWLFMFGDKVKILSPEYLVNKMSEMAKKVIDLYAQSQ
ncbi:MAG: WYL domain-containing protein [Clostridiaceae bacterium]|nr:WYL domain-containing protein [Clostridiaceae bacterium]